MFYANKSMMVSNNTTHYDIYSNVQEDVKYRFLYEFFCCIEDDGEIFNNCKEGNRYEELSTVF